MARALLFAFFLVLALSVVALISCLSAEDGEVRALPRWAWVPVILFFPLVGPAAYLLAGRPMPADARTGLWRAGSGGADSERPRRQLAPDDDPDFLRRLGQQGRRNDEDLLRRWEDDLRRRERDPRKPEDTPPPDG